LAQTKKMSPAAKEKGREFFEALLQEGHDYKSMQQCVREVLVLVAMEKHHNLTKAGAMLGVSQQAVGLWLKEAGINLSSLRETA
jgi:hypothetical protein